eukprot:189158_1
MSAVELIDSLIGTFESFSTKSTNELCNCEQLKNLKDVFRQYNDSFGIDIAKINISSILNDFLYIMYQLQATDEFEYVYNQMGGYCDCNECDAFTRNYRHRNEQQQYKYQCLNDIVICQIMDKIHCYFSHCFDLGYKLTEADITMVNEDQKKDHTNDDFESQFWISNKIKNIYSFLWNKRAKCSNISQINCRLKSKFNQICTQHTYVTTNKDDGKYSFGFKFAYGYDDEIETTNIIEENNDAYTAQKTDHIHVKQKYSSLKVELTDNCISKLVMEQFIIEYKKCNIHYGSRHRKKNYPNIFIENLLSIMIYCNYDQLQYHFSKTYRTDHGNQHQNFYHIGKNLKLCVQKFGQRVRDGDVNSFYHGVSTPLLFNQYIGARNQGISIYCPLSTSSSFEVAINFTNFNKGLLAQFGGELSSAKYFSASWLSDYGNEFEYLFIQNDGMYQQLQIQNIVDAEFGYEYQHILDSLRTLEKITWSGSSIGITPATWSDRSDNINIDRDTETLIQCIVSNELSNMIPEYRSMKSLTEYAQQLIKVYCNNKTHSWVDFAKIKHPKYSFLCNLLFQEKCQWIKIKEMNVLYPNLKEIMIQHGNLTSSAIDEIWMFLSDSKFNYTLTSICIIEMDKSSSLAPSIAINKYATQFKQMGFNLSTMGNDSLFISRICDKQDTK